MINLHFVRIARDLASWTVTIAVLWAFWGSAGQHRKAKSIPDGGIEFTPNRRSYWAWALLVAYLIYASVRRLMHINAGWLNLDVAITFAGLVVIIALPFPAAIHITADGLEQISWLWKNKRIRWENIAEINTGEKSRTVTITDVGGTRVIHSQQLPDRARLLMEIKHYCGESLPADFPREPLLSESEK